MQEPVTISVHLHAKAFRSFALFDALRLKRKARMPMLFAAILILFAAACFILNNEENQGALLGVLLLIIGLGMPAVYFRMYARSVQMQIKRFGLDKPKYLYTLTLGEESGLAVRDASGKQSAHPWESLYGIYGSAGNVYIYTAFTQAYILPKDQLANSQDALRELFERKVQREKLHL